MSAEPLSRRRVARGALGAGAAFAALTLATHVANFGFTVAAGRLLAPADFGRLTALLGVVLLGMAPGMAFQALTAASVLGRPVVVDASTTGRLAVAVGATVAVVMVVLRPALDVDGVAVVAVATAAALLPLTAANEGLLQGRGQFVVLGTVMVAGAVTKLVLGTAGMSATGLLGPATLAIAVGYLVQLGLSRQRAGPLPHRDGLRTATPQVLSAVVLVGLLLAVVHADAVLAQALLEAEEAGRYAVGVLAARITFWLPQFALLLIFPRLVRDTGQRTQVTAVGVVALLGTTLALASRVVGAPAVAALFGPELAPIGPELWRFAWLGTANLGLQVLVLADLAHGRRRSAVVLVSALVAAAVGLLLLDPSSATGVITVVATSYTLLLGVGLGHRLASGAPAVPGGGDR